mmetsp:Transcript_94771/g.138384  ORF Transcript_94771/g.138384 Transcript_94771/m.138384 type:complete len:362 (+) Transcript_94771:173-1258(+)
MGKDEVDKKCEICFDEVEPDDVLSLACNSNHLICGECSYNYANSVLQDASFPPKCSTCRAPMPLAAFERVLKPEQHATYLNIAAMHDLELGESVVNCTHCSYFEIRTDEPCLFYCQKPDCKVGHCCTCKANLPLIGEDDDDDGFEEDSKQAEHLRHLKCGALKVEKKLFEQALQKGSSMACPSCGVLGRKDGMCTHMTCACGTTWCYVCELGEGECDKAPRKDSMVMRTPMTSEAGMYAHNEDYEYNSKRCPMYLNLLQIVDEAWGNPTGEDDEDDAEDGEDEEVFEEYCVSKLHHWRTLRLLKELKNKLGAPKWTELKDAFESVRNCGFRDHEIDSAGGALYQRKKNPTKRTRDSDADSD